MESGILDTARKFEITSESVKFSRISLRFIQATKLYMLDSSRRVQ